MQQPIGKNDPEIISTAKENQYFDRKSARKDTKEISRHICAFANASGGKLVIGIEDSYIEVRFDSDDKKKKPSRKFMFPSAFFQGLLQIG